MKRLLPVARLAALAALLGATRLVAPALPADEPLDTLPRLASGALRVYLVRHGQALSNLDPVPDLPPEQLDHLTARGKDEAEAVGRALAGRRVSVVLTSPASRARETAERIARALGLSPTIESRLGPMALGSGVTWKDRTTEWEAGRDPRPPGGESMAHVANRVDELVRATARSRRGQGAVLVAHGEVLAAYLGHLRGTPAPQRYPAGLANGSLTVVDVAATGAATIRCVNYLPAGRRHP